MDGLMAGRRGGLPLTSLMSVLATVILFGVLIAGGSFFSYRAEAAGADFELKAVADKVNSQCELAESRTGVDLCLNKNIAAISMETQNVMKIETTNGKTVTRQVRQCASVTIDDRSGNGKLNPSDNGILTVDLNYDASDGSMTVVEKQPAEDCSETASGGSGSGGSSGGSGGSSGGSGSSSGGGGDGCDGDDTITPDKVDVTAPDSINSAQSTQGTVAIEADLTGFSNCAHLRIWIENKLSVGGDWEKQFSKRCSPGSTCRLEKQVGFGNPDMFGGEPETATVHFKVTQDNQFNNLIKKTREVKRK